MLVSTVIMEVIMPLVLASGANMFFENDDRSLAFFELETMFETVHRNRFLLPYRRGGVHGRRWAVPLNDVNWFFRYAVSEEYVSIGAWRAMFRVTPVVYGRLVDVLGPHIRRTNTNMRSALRVELRIAAFLVWSGGAKCSIVANTLGIGTSTVPGLIREVSREICTHFRDVVFLPTSDADIKGVMDGFKRISGLPHCVGAIDGCHVRWHACPISQWYEYRCFKNYPSVIIFAVCDAARRFTYADVCLPGVLADGTLWARSKLKDMIDKGEWLGGEVPSLKIGDVHVRPYLLGDCAFPLGTNMMKTTTSTQQSANPDLRIWERHAADTRKPIECAFGILKNRFMCLKEGLRLHHEDDISFCITACIVLHNLSLQYNDLGADFEDDSISDHDIHFTSEHTDSGIKTRDALLHYLLLNA